MGKDKEFDATVKFGDDGSTETDVIEASSLADATRQIQEQAEEFDKAVGDPNAVTVESVRPHEG